MAPKTATAFRLSDEAKALLKKMAINSGITMSAILELAIRDYAKKEDVK